MGGGGGGGWLVGWLVFVFWGVGGSCLVLSSKRTLCNVWRPFEDLAGCHNWCRGLSATGI